MDIEFRSFGLDDVETREADDHTGHVSAHFSIFGNQDNFGTVFDKGAFKRTIKNNQGKFAITWFHHPDCPIGIGLFEEDDKGLRADTEIDLDAAAGHDVFSGIKRGYIDCCSIGFRRITEALKDGIVHLKEVKLYEGAFITRGFAANELAKVESIRAATAGVRRINQALQEGATEEFQAACEELRMFLDTVEIRGATSFLDLPLADREREWDASAAEKRVRAWAGAGDEPNAKYRKAFMWYKSDAPDNFTSYKLLYADVVDGQLKAVPRAIFAIAVVLQGGRGGVDIPADDKAKVKSHCEKYYAKMRKEFDDEDIIAPWKRSIEVPPWADGLLEEIKEMNALLKLGDPSDDTPRIEDPQRTGSDPRKHSDLLLEGFRQLGRGLHETLEKTR